MFSCSHYSLLCTCLVPSLLLLLSPSRLSPERCHPKVNMAGPIETRRPSFLANSRVSHSHLHSLHTSSCPPSYHNHKYKAFETSSISDKMRNWDEDSQSQSHASSKSKQEPDQISASTQIKMDSTTSSKKTPDDLDLSKATTYRENTEITGSTIAASAVQAPFDPVARKKLLRKLDRHLIPFLALIYLYGS
jgi:hypothetical protein